MNNCPFDFINEFDKWFYYHKCVFFEKLTREQIITDMHMISKGWERVDGRYGGWSRI